MKTKSLVAVLALLFAAALSFTPTHAHALCANGRVQAGTWAKNAFPWAGWGFTAHNTGDTATFGTFTMSSTSTCGGGGFNACHNWYWRGFQYGTVGENAYIQWYFASSFNPDQILGQLRTRCGTQNPQVYQITNTATAP